MMASLIIKRLNNLRLLSTAGMPPVHVVSESNLSYRWQEDCFYLLAAPDNGEFYSPRNPLADINRQGSSWLALQKQWPGGWQLWLVLSSQRLGVEM